MQTFTYRESQRLDDLILYITLAFLAIMNLLIYRIFLENDLIYFRISVVTFIFLTLVIMFFRLSTRFAGAGIYYRLFPLQKKEKSVAWNDIVSVENITVKPLRDFGGYGIRENKAANAVILNGYKAIKIQINQENKPLIIGIQHPNKVREVLLKYLPEKKVLNFPL